MTHFYQCDHPLVICDVTNLGKKYFRSITKILRKDGCVQNCKYYAKSENSILGFKQSPHRTSVVSSREKRVWILYPLEGL